MYDYVLLVVLLLFVYCVGRTARLPADLPASQIVLAAAILRWCR